MCSFYVDEKGIGYVAYMSNNVPTLKVLTKEETDEIFKSLCIVNELCLGR